MPRNRSQRKPVTHPNGTIAKGLYRDSRGYSAMVFVGTGPTRRQQEKRFELAASLKAMTTWQTKTRAKLLEKAAATKVVPGTLKADVPRYLKQFKGKPSVGAKSSHLKAWIAAKVSTPGGRRVSLGDLKRSQILEEHVRTVMAEWEAAGVAPKTVRHRWQILGHLGRTLDGKKARTPCDDVQAPKPTRTRPVWVDDAIIREVAYNLQAQERAGKLRDAKTRARYMVLASSGKRPAELKRTQPTDVDTTRRVWMVRDAKGGWSEGLYLNEDMLAAWALFITAEAWGHFDTRSFDRRLYRAGWLQGIRPYNLRHSTGLSLSANGEDLADIQAWMGHTDIKTTRDFYVPVLGGRMQKMSERIDGRFDWSPEKKLAPQTGPMKKD